jgi:hypothetical protein
MNFLKKWIWGEGVSERPPPAFFFINFKSKCDLIAHCFIKISQETEDQQPQQDTTTRPSTSSRRQDHPARIDPLLRDVPGGKGGGVQGLDWYSQSLLEDADGDCATDFLEEPQPEPSDERGPAAKKLHMAALQSQKGQVSPAHVNRLHLERGNVTSSVYSTSNKRS